ncbi:MAG: right-handed parallel beta-helix repeat-containing protein, partial [Candidatus Firestonebacteria bacterium]
EVPGKAIIDGSDTDIAKAKWEKVDPVKYPDVYKISYKTQPQMIFYKDNLMFPFENIEDVKTCIYQGKRKTGLYGGWWWDGDNLYIKIPKEPYTKQEGEGVNPNKEGRNIKVVKSEKAFEVKADYVVLDGFTVQFVNEGVNLRGANNVVIRNNIIQRMINGVFSVKYVEEPEEVRSSFALIENNEITCCPTFFYRDWGLGHDNVGTQGIMLDSGEGNMVRNNKVHDVENGIYVGGTWEKGDAVTMANPNYNQGTVVAGNEIYRIGDDGVEIDGACHNQVICNNFIRDVHTGLSIAPNSVGPLWVLRNKIYLRPRNKITGELDLEGDFLNAPFKFNVTCNVGAGPTVIYHNTAVVECPAKDIPAFTKAWGNTPGLNIITRNNSFTANPGWYTIYIASKDIEKRILKLDLDYDNLYRKEPPLAKFEGYKKYQDLKDFQNSTGFEKHGLNVMPKFADLLKGDFSFKKESPLVDSGVILPGINNDYSGKAPDIGAVELIKKQTKR